MELEASQKQPLIKPDYFWVVGYWGTGHGQPGTVNPEYFVCTKFSYVGNLRPFVRMKFSYSHWPLRIFWLALVFSRHLIFVRKPPFTKYTKIKCIRNNLDLQYPMFLLQPKNQVCNYFNSKMVCGNSLVKFVSFYPAPKEKKVTLLSSISSVRVLLLRKDFKFAWNGSSN